MDHDRFDRLARSLGAAATRRDGLRAALGGLLGAATAAGNADADTRRRGKDNLRPGATKRRKHECGPDAPCPTGFDCLKQGKKRRCSCSTGVVCGDACCPTGQVCQNGACIVPTTCIAPGEPCKGVGKPCCDGRTCASGQGGETDVACYVHKTGACQSTADCVYGTACIDGRCGFDVPPPAALGAPCDPTVGQQCTDPAAVCTTYNGPDAPSGAFCILPLNATCTGDPECTCYTCDYPNPGDSRSTEGRQARAGLDTRLACCGPEGYACRSDRNCCLGSICVNGTCQSETACDVCATGCPYATIRAAVADAAGKPAGSTITIAPGTYNESVDVVRNLTFRRCGRSGSVRWRAANNVAVNGQNKANLSELGLANIDFEIEGDAAVKTVRTSSGPTIQTTVLACTFTSYPQRQFKTYQAIDLGTLTDTNVIGSTFRGIEATKLGAAIFMVTSDSSLGDIHLSMEGCTFENNVSTPQGLVWGGLLFAKGTAGAIARMAVSDSVFRNNATRGAGTLGGVLVAAAYSSVAFEGATVMEGNSAVAAGGAIFATSSDLGSGSGSGPVEVSLVPSVAIRGNSAANGGGIARDTAAGTPTVSGASAAAISGNMPDQCATSANGTDWTTVANCAY